MDTATYTPRSSNDAVDNLPAGSKVFVAVAPGFQGYLAYSETGCFLGLIAACNCKIHEGMRAVS